jgi:hypothetical protein
MVEELVRCVQASSGSLPTILPERTNPPGIGSALLNSAL